MTKAILAILFLGASVMTFVLYIRPTYDDVKENRAAVAQFDGALDRTREIQELKESLLTRYNVFVGENLDRLQKMLPDHVDNVRLVLDLDGMASRYGLRLQNVTVQQRASDSDNERNGTVLNGGANQNKPYQSLTLQFQVVATYNDFIRLLRDLESSLRIVDLVSLSVRPYAGSQQAEGSEPLYTFGVALRTYWLK